MLVTALTAAAQFDCRCCESLTILRGSDLISREAWKRSRFWRKIFVGLKRGKTKREFYKITRSDEDETHHFVSHKMRVRVSFLPILLNKRAR